jgi:hypothetical protein
MPTLTKQQAIVMTTPTKKSWHLMERRRRGRKSWTNNAPKKTASEATAFFFGDGARHQNLGIKFAMMNNLQKKQTDNFIHQWVTAVILFLFL